VLFFAMPQVINKDESSRNSVNAQKAKEAAKATHYSLLGVQEQATAEEVKLAFRQLALRQHPDKGGDADKFHELQMAFNVLEIQDRRDAYDAELQRQRDRAEFVEGAPVHKEPTNAPARVKTAPTPGSKRSKKIEGMGGSEWKMHGSGIGIMKMIEDGATVEAKAQVLFEKYKELPRNLEKKREWLKGVRGDEKIALKAHAKAVEKEKMEKLQKWLGKA